jgi:hypothetical protein
VASVELEPLLLHLAPPSVLRRRGRAIGGPKSIEGGGAPQPPGADPAAGGSPLPPSHAASSSQEQGGIRAWRNSSSPFGAEGGSGVTGEREAVGPADGWDGERPQHPREHDDRWPCCKMQQLMRLLLEPLQCA